MTCDPHRHHRHCLVWRSDRRRIGIAASPARNSLGPQGAANNVTRAPARSQPRVVKCFAPSSPAAVPRLFGSFSSTLLSTLQMRFPGGGPIADEVARTAARRMRSWRRFTRRPCRSFWTTPPEIDLWLDAETAEALALQRSQPDLGSGLWRRGTGRTGPVVAA